MLVEGEHGRVAKSFTALDELYVKEVPVSVLRLRFFGCVQKPGQSIQAYSLHSRELYPMLKHQDEDGAPTETHLRDQFMLGLEDGALSRALASFTLGPKHNLQCSAAGGFPTGGRNKLSQVA